MFILLVPSCTSKAGQVLMENRPNNPNIKAQTSRFLLLSSSVNSLNLQGLQVFF